MVSSITALTIASSDSSGGAGIQADLKAFAAVGTHGCSVIICITAQNITDGVTAIHELPADIIEAQFKAVTSDFKVGAIKTGMLYSPDNVESISKKITEYRARTTTGFGTPIPLVVDPVMVATTGKNLVKTDDFVNALKSELIPIATVLMPNLYEASQLVGWQVETLADMKQACTELSKLGSEYVLIKGGHTVEAKGTVTLTSKAVDILYCCAPDTPEDEQFTEFGSPRLPKTVHGSGCTFSALITGLLANGLELKSAVGEAKERIAKSIQFGYFLQEMGSEHARGPEPIAMVDTITSDQVIPAKLEIKQKLANAVDSLKQLLTPEVVPRLMPEVGINFGYALPGAQSSEDICALEGRLVKLGTNKVATPGSLKFGVSKHVAAIILAAMKFDENIRAVMNIKYRDNLIAHITQAGLSTGSFDRAHEPEHVSTMEWGTGEVVKSQNCVPDVIFDKGGIGKEPMIRVFGNDPDDVLKKLSKIIKQL